MLFTKDLHFSFMMTEVVRTKYSTRNSCFCWAQHFIVLLYPFLALKKDDFEIQIWSSVTVKCFVSLVYSFLYMIIRQTKKCTMNMQWDYHLQMIKKHSVFSIWKSIKFTCSLFCFDCLLFCFRWFIQSFWSSLIAFLCNSRLEFTSKWLWNSLETITKRPPKNFDLK